MANIQIVSCSSFRSYEFYVRPDVLGRAHDFALEGRQMQIQLPAESETNAEMKGYTSASCCEWEKVDGEDVPVTYAVSEVALLIPHTTQVEVNEALAYSGRIDKTLATSQNEAKLLNDIAGEHNKLASKAFEHWLRVIRWKNIFWRIGRPPLMQSEQGTELLEEQTRKRFWVNSSGVLVPGYKPITVEVWQEAQEALTEDHIPPAWFEYLFDAQYKMETGDIPGCILSLSIACETMFREILYRQIPKRDQADEELSATLSEINVRALMNRIPRFAFWKAEGWKKHVDFERINKLLNLRNTSAHRGSKISISVAELIGLIRAAEAFVGFADRALQARIVRDKHGEAEKCQQNTAHEPMPRS